MTSVRPFRIGFPRLSDAAPMIVAEIASAFLVPETTMAQRISRAKQSIKGSGVPFRQPADRNRPSPKPIASSVSPSAKAAPVPSPSWPSGVSVSERMNFGMGLVRMILSVESDFRL